MDRADRAGIHPYKRVPQGLANSQNSVHIVPGHKRERSCLAAADDPFIGDDLHNTGVHIDDRRKGYLHRFFKPKTCNVKLYIGDDHVCFLSTVLFSESEHRYNSYYSIFNDILC